MMPCAPLHLSAGERMLAQKNTRKARPKEALLSKPLAGKQVVLGVSGSVAAYKAAFVASRLAQLGAKVTTVLTDAGARFVAPLTFQSVTGAPAYTDADLWGAGGHVLHVGLGRDADLVVIAPATANTLAKLAHGQADNLLTLTALSTHAPLLVAPAMDGGMFAHPATQANLEALAARGVHLLGPAEGHLASGLVGKGRMVEPEAIIGQARYLLTRGGPLQGKRVVVTAGGTQEPIDPVRVVANRSSGKQGFALAQAALDFGAEVVLVSGPTALPTPAGAQRVDVRTAAEMQEAVFRHLDEADLLLMAAAVADYRPAAPAEHKIKKGRDRWELPLTRTTDILGTLAAQREAFPRLQLVVGFAAESRDLLEHAQQKLEAKRLDLIVANDITAPQAGFGVDTNKVTLLYADGLREDLPLMSKAEVAQAVLLRALVLLEGGFLGHLVPRRAWERAQALGEYAPPSLEAEGFIHLSRLDQIPRVQARFYSGREDLLLLKIRFPAIAGHLRWEAADGEVFPHLYAPLPLEAVAAAETVTAVL